MRFVSIVQLVALVALFHLGKSLEGHCGGDCLFSEDCALEAGDQNCRCSYFHCRELEGTCGGGCISNQQCSQWSGDLNCVCGTLYECIDRHQAESKSYQAYVKFMMSARGSVYQQKVNEMLSLQATKSGNNL